MSTYEIALHPKTVESLGLESLVTCKAPVLGGSAYSELLS